MGSKVNCGNPEHSSIFEILCNLLLGWVGDYVIWGCRSGSKTYIFGGLDTFYKSCRFPGYSTKILGGSEGQSALSYTALSEFFSLVGQEFENEMLVDGLHKTSADWVNKSSVSILPASSKSVRGPHTISLKLDEVDEIDPIIFEDALPIPQSMNGHPSVTGMFSTNHQVQGQMDEAIAQAEIGGDTVFKFCVWEIMERCVDYSCSTCHLGPYCPGPDVMKEADGYYQIDDFVKKLHKMSVSALSRDYLCLKVGRGDGIYEREFDEKIHVVNVPLDMNKPVAISVDWGGVDPFSIGVWQKAPEKFGDDAWVRVTELYLTSKKQSATNQQLIKLAKTAPWWKLIKWFIPDNSRADLIQEWDDAFTWNVETILSDKKSIDAGIEVVKSALAPVLGAPLMFINRICTNWLREVTTYIVKNEKPRDKYNHAMDDTRYFAMAMIKTIQTAGVAFPKSNVYRRR